MCDLTKLLQGISYRVIKGSLNKEISDICYDTRDMKAQCAFICIKGFNKDSHDMVNQAVYKGATVIICETEVKAIGDVTVICVNDTREALSVMSANLYDNPADKMIMVGVTGTKGKTTTVYMIAKILESAGIKTGIIGSIEVRYDNISIKNENTTPESYIIQQTIHKMYKAGVQAVVMEVSSQGLKLKRVHGITFDYAVFTNISNDHIGKNEHESMDEYIFWKTRLFKQSRCGIFNSDDAMCGKMREESECDRNILYGIDEAKKIRYEIINGAPGVKCEINDTVIDISLPGIYSVYNVLAAIKVCNEILSDDETETLMYLYAEVFESFGVKGRTEIIKLKNGAYAVIDYAHNALALESLLKAMRIYVKGKLVCLFGCGGNRALTRRYEMGETAAKYADYVVITSDNPRYENPLDIMEDIESGVLHVYNREDRDKKYVLIEDRKDAVEISLSKLQENDMIIIAGKGHEDYQEIRGRRYHLDDREIVNMYNEQ